MRCLRVVRILSAITVFGCLPVVQAGSTGASQLAAKPPTVSTFRAAPTSALGFAGGPVTLSASVTHATKCTFSANHPITGLPVTIACGTGTVSRSVTFTVNAGTSIISDKLTITVKGATGTKAAAASLTVTLAPKARVSVTWTRCQPHWVQSDRRQFRRAST